jgi:hypothetical protein
MSLLSTTSSQCTHGLLQQGSSQCHFLSKIDSHLKCICFLHSVRAFGLWHWIHGILHCNYSLVDLISFPRLWSLWVWRLWLIKRHQV